MANTTATITVTWGTDRATMRAGLPLDQYGNIANNSSAYGILAEDLNLPDRQATVITAGEWTEDPSCGVVLSDACKAALSAIAFDSPKGEFVSVTDVITQAQIAALF